MPAPLLLLFGASGDLTQRKLLPALYHAFAERDDRPMVLGVGRSDLGDDGFRKAARKALKEADAADGAKAWCDEALHYVAVDDYGALGPVLDRAEALEAEHALSGDRLFYLALPPVAFPTVIEALGEAGQSKRDEGWTRLVVEKPFGRDLDSARELNALLHRHFGEEQVYRIDHYLGKETVQNLLVFRFANALFESVWNRNHIARVEITVAEDGDAAGRAGYYDKSGALRDMVQNHLMQLLTLTAMEVPARFDAEGIRQEKIKVLRSMPPAETDRVVFGQYEAGDAGEGYREHDDVPDDSTTETFVALRLGVHNWRWQGVPFLLRTGKQMPERLTEIVVHFHRPPVHLFGGPDACAVSRNVLRIRLQPDEGFSLGFEVKAPRSARDGGIRLTQQHLHFDYGDAFGRLPDAYETLLLDVVDGDQTLFVHADETEAAWKLVAPLLEAEPRIHPYPAGSWGPTEAQRLFYG